MATNKEAVDCAQALTATSAVALKSSGIVAVGRYLGKKNMNWWKTIGPDEVKIIHDAGLALILIWEGNPTYPGYFDYAKGFSDAKLAADEAKYLGAPSPTAIYFAVDYDAQAGDMSEIIAYFEGVRDGLAGQYLTGAYGSYAVLNALHNSAFPPDRYFQTYAWSGVQVFPGNHIYQYQNDVAIAGVALDRDKIQSGAGTWPELLEEVKYMSKHAIIYFTVTDFSTAKIVADRLGNCGMFCRNADNAAIHPDAKVAEHLIVIGGAAYNDHPNVTNCCGKGAPETAILAAQYAQTL